MEVYARELLAALPAAAPRYRFTAFVNRETAARPDALPSSIERVLVPVNARNRVEWVRGEQQFLPGLARRAGVSLLHSLASTAPGRGRYRRVVTVHDLNYRTVPEAHLGLLGLGMRVLVPLAARTANRVIADSWSTRADLVRLLGLRAAKVDVVHPGFGVSPAPALGAAETRWRFSLPAGRPLLLCLSAMRPHKNLAGLLRALALLDPRPVAVLAGYETPHVAELRELAGELGVAADVRFPGWISSSEVEGLFALTASPSRSRPCMRASACR